MLGLPLITCEVGTGTSYVNEAGKTGLVVPPADSDALAQAMLELESDPARCERMGKASHERFIQLFTAESMSRKYLNLYRQLVTSEA